MHVRKDTHVEWRDGIARALSRRTREGAEPVRSGTGSREVDGKVCVHVWCVQMTKRDLDEERSEMRAD